VDVYTIEDQQVEALKRWWKENAKSILLGIALGLAAVFGWRAWQAYQQNLGEGASVRYDQLMQLIQQGEMDRAREVGAQIVNDFGSTTYAFFSALALARLALEKDQLDAARQHLQWAYERAPQEPLKHITRLRLARVMLAQGQAQQAIDLIRGANSEAFAAQYREVEGDAYQALGKRVEAQEAYAKALQAVGGEHGGEHRERLQMKLDDLGGIEAKAS
jgi:predicted negative regulator of RcsB-dependent stress response